ncbi:NUDIX hydrolase [Pedobacter punctiformis]|uniref:NUDIX domain-containing protein n=1 Tax=Pedobacter punctiformis TaxID=3004097 RepID=A0ABT4L9X2_9SPHI|nr:NUDIX domain-containing protein [Pedobacter sp. HCMS5-2]MCZ4244732.1 NUDIX domain-containing protein [Pedobacter sp. HCMS5-2]
MKQSAGLLPFRKTKTETEFFLVHPGGPFFAKKDAGWWTISKGEIMENEKPLNAAIREFEEETSFLLNGSFIELNPVVQKAGKKVLCWAIEADCDHTKMVSNTFEIEWPPRSGKMKSFPEIDKAGWFNYTEASKLINERQIAFLDQLISIL